MRNVLKIKYASLDKVDYTNYKTCEQDKVGLQTIEATIQRLEQEIASSKTSESDKNNKRTALTLQTKNLATLKTKLESNPAYDFWGNVAPNPNTPTYNFLLNINLSEKPQEFNKDETSEIPATPKKVHFGDEEEDDDTASQESANDSEFDGKTAWTWKDYGLYGLAGAGIFSLALAGYCWAKSKLGGN